MHTYKYKARDSAGKLIQGNMEAISKSELTDKLHKLGYMVTQIGEFTPSLKVPSLGHLFQHISVEEVVLFNIQLANLINAGIPLLASLQTLGQQIENKKLRETVKEIARSVESGESLSEALSYQTQIFHPIFINMVKVGEASGKLDIILLRYAAYCEQQVELSQKIKGAVFYPAILLVAGISVALFIVTYILPQFVSIFLKAHVPLPLPTLIIYNIGIAIKQFWLSFLLTAIFMCLAVQYYVTTPFGRLQCDRLKLALPVLGSLFRKAAISKFGRTLGMLVSSGAPVLQSLEIVRGVVGNEVLARVVDQTRSAVEKGERISETLRVSREFPLDTVQMISVGEETGKLDEMLNKIALFYDRGVDYSVKKLTTLVEPLLLIFMGCLIGLIMASMFLPMFDMIKIIKT